MQKAKEKHKNLQTMLKLTSFSMFKLMVPYFQPFWTPQYNIGHEKHPFNMWWILNFFLSHIVKNYKVHHILHILKFFTPKCHSPWNYNTSQNCEKIFDFIASNESITFFYGLWPHSCLEPKAHILWKINVFCNYLKVRTKKLVSCIWFHFVGIFNLQVAYGFYKIVCVQPKKICLRDILKNP